MRLNMRGKSQVRFTHTVGVLSNSPHGRMVMNSGAWVARLLTWWARSSSAVVSAPPLLILRQTSSNLIAFGPRRPKIDRILWNMSGSDLRAAFSRRVAFASDPLSRRCSRSFSSNFCNDAIEIIPSNDRRRSSCGISLSTVSAPEEDSG